MDIVIDADLAARTRSRVTRRLIPYLMFLYLLAYIDRANLGVAKLHMQSALGFNDAVVGLGAGIFYLGYLLLDLPGSLIVERWGARLWIARIMVSWGFVTTAMAFLGSRFFGSIQPATQFYGLRLLLGISEAGFFPGIIVYLSHWYQPEDRASAKASFMIAQPIAIAIGVPMSRCILEYVHLAGFDSWRWVFILEGLPPIIMGVVTLYYLTDRPQSARWLSQEEKAWLISRLKADEDRKVAAGRVTVMDALRYPQTFLLITVSFLTVTGNQALIFFLPSITDSMKSMPVMVRTLAAALPYVFGAMGILINGNWAQRTGKLKWHTAIPILSTGTCIGLAALAHNHLWLTMGLFCLAGFTAQAYLPAFWTLPTTLLGKAAAATAVGLICLGNLGGFVGPTLFGYLKAATGQYNLGLLVLSGCMLLAGMLATQIRSSQNPRLVLSNDND